MHARHILFTDLDGTLLDHDSYEPGPTRKAVRRVQEAGVPIVFCSARTRVEQQWLRRDFGVDDPFIVENGGAIFVPKGYFSKCRLSRTAVQDVAPKSGTFEEASSPPQERVTGSARSRSERGKLKGVPPLPPEYGAPPERSGDSLTAPCPGEALDDEPLEVVAFGMAYDQIRSRLHRAADLAGVRVRGYGDMSLEEVAGVTGLDLDGAARARAREFGESFLILDDSLRDDPGSVDRLRTELARLGMNLTRGTRLWAAMGAHDKGRAVRHLTRLFEEHFGPVTTCGIADYLNDVPMLEAVDVPVLLQRPGGQWADIEVANLKRISAVGPEGWCLAVDELLELS